jgi:biotin transporter BioY
MAGIAGVALIFLGGLAQLTVVSGSIGRAVALGITPFAALDLVKAWVAAAITGSRIARHDT